MWHEEADIDTAKMKGSKKCQIGSHLSNIVFTEYAARQRGEQNVNYTVRCC